LGSAWLLIRSVADPEAMKALANPRAALVAMFALAAASLLVLLGDGRVGPTWVHWVGSLVAVVAALGVVVIADVGWHRALTSAKSAGLVSPETDA
jgi:energy-coupling factor transporter transmembrane protein EcfT